MNQAAEDQIQESEDQVGFDLFGWIHENWVWAAPLIYIYVTIVGMFESWFQFNAFGINVFEFSELNDFLLAAFREPLSFLAILGIIAYGSSGILAQWILQKRLRQKRSPERVKRLRRLRRLFMYPSFVIFVLIAPYYGPNFLHKSYGQKWKDQFIAEPDRNVKVLIKDIEKSGTQSGWIENLSLIGTTDKFVFFVNHSTNDVLISPVSNVVLIERVKLSNKANSTDAKSRAAD